MNDHTVIPSNAAVILSEAAVILSEAKDLGSLRNEPGFVVVPLLRMTA